jgi:hypothetical protein
MSQSAMRPASACRLTAARNKPNQKPKAKNMKFVSTANFRGSPLIKCEKQIHPLHVHKGARFSIGGDLPMEKLTPAEQKFVAELNIAGRIVEVSQVELVAKIDAEVARAVRSDELVSAHNQKATNGTRNNR